MSTGRVQLNLWYKAQNSHLDNSFSNNFSLYFNLKQKQFSQTMLAIMISNHRIIFGFFFIPTSPQQFWIILLFYKLCVTEKIIKSKHLKFPVFEQFCCQCPVINYPGTVYYILLCTIARHIFLQELHITTLWPPNLNTQYLYQRNIIFLFRKHIKKCTPFQPR